MPRLDEGLVSDGIYRLRAALRLAWVARAPPQILFLTVEGDQAVGMFSSVTLMP